VIELIPLIFPLPAPCRGRGWRPPSWRSWQWWKKLRQIWNRCTQFWCFVCIHFVKCGCRRRPKYYCIARG